MITASPETCWEACTAQVCHFWGRFWDHLWPWIKQPASLTDKENEHQGASLCVLGCKGDYLEMVTLLQEPTVQQRTGNCCVILKWLYIQVIVWTHKSGCRSIFWSRLQYVALCVICSHVIWMWMDMWGSASMCFVCVGLQQQQSGLTDMISVANHIHV